MKFTDYANNWIHVGSGFRLSRATIVGPYPTHEFMEQVLSLGPDEVVLAVDDGWPQERIEAIQQTLAGRARFVLRRVAPPGGGGLVHAKLYCFEWVNGPNNRRRHTLLAGSANASVQGFGGHAESFVHVDLADIDIRNKKAALQYFTDLASGHDTAHTWFYIHDKSWLSLPPLRIVHTPWPNGFDAWIRRGRLCHSYQPDPTFGRLVLRLKEPMPQGLLGANLGNAGFSQTGEMQAFTRPYVRYTSGEPDAAIERQNWRQRYFTETVYGYWTSAECFSALEDSFVAPQADGRRRALDAIREPGPEHYSRWVGEFTDSIHNVSRTLTGKQRETYFHLQRSGELDEDRYRQLADSKLARDREKSKDDYFCRRFTSGFAFPPVPALGDEFDDFLVELCANLLAKLQARQVRNKLATALRHHGIADRGTTPEELLDQLRYRWDQLKPELTNFHAEKTRSIV